MLNDEKQFEISQYIDGDLSGPRRERLEAEMAEDDDARQVLEDFRGVNDWAKAATPPMPRVNFSKLGTRIMERLPERQSRTIRLAWWTGAAMAAAAAIVIAVILPMQPTTTPGPESTWAQTQVVLVTPQRVEGITIEFDLAGSQADPLPKTMHPTPGGTIIIDVPTYASSEPPRDTGIVIAMSGPAPGDVLINAGPETDGWDPTSMEMPM